MWERLLNEVPRFFEYYSAIFLLKAMGTTLLMTLVGVGIGFLLGFVIVYLRQTPGLYWVPIRIIAITYVEVFRRIPFLVILYFHLIITCN